MKNNAIYVALLLLVLLGIGYYLAAKTSNGINPNNLSVSFDQTGNLVMNNPGLDPNAWYLNYETPGAPAQLAKLNFVQGSRCFRNSMSGPCDITQFTQGDRARVEGLQEGSVVTVVRLTMLSPTQTKSISLYYYNETKDQELGNGNPACSRDAILPVARKIAVTNTPIQDAIRELIKGELTADERAQGFTTEFPNSKFDLLGADLKSGVLTLEFTEVPGFTTGGSCRITILANQIIKTAMQFPEVKSVKFKPEELFQP